MKLLKVILALLLMITMNHTSMAQSGKESWIQHTSIKTGAVRNTLRVPKVKLFRSNPHKFTHVYFDTHEDDEVTDDDLMSPYRRQDLFRLVEQEDVSDNIRWKLFLIRQLALLKHQQIHG